jgi:hypothetical protein
MSDRAHHPIVALPGAGLSKESGLDTVRDDPRPAVESIHGPAGAPAFVARMLVGA